MATKAKRPVFLQYVAFTVTDEDGCTDIITARPYKYCRDIGLAVTPICRMASGGGETCAERRDWWATQRAQLNEIIAQADTFLGIVVGVAAIPQ